MRPAPGYCPAAIRLPDKAIALLLAGFLILVVTGCNPGGEAVPGSTAGAPAVPVGQWSVDAGHPGRPRAEELGYGGPVEGPATRITREGIFDDTAILSADNMKGRAPATVGEERAIRHIESRFAEIGLEPVTGGSYRLPVELLGMTKDATASSVSIDGPAGALELIPGTNFTFWSTSEQPRVELQDVPLIFVGHGVQAPEYDWDDFKGEDVSGAVLLFLNDDPSVVENGEALFGGDARTYYGRWTYKFEQAQAQGAAGAIVIHTFESAAYAFEVIGSMGEGQVWQRDYHLDFLAWIDSAQTAEVARHMGTDVPGLFDMASERDFRPVDTGFRVTSVIETGFERLEAYNVAGVIRGTDPELADEFVVFTAHHDHLGWDSTLDGDGIFNGALDNAVGVASIIAVAEAFAEAEPRRSVMFLSVTAEEGGLLGSGHFVENPPVPRSSLIANINVDSPQNLGVTSDVAAIGIDMNTLGPVFEQVVRYYGLTPAGDPNPMAGSFYRSDQLSFAKAGIPALYLQAGRNYVGDTVPDVNALRNERYHTVNDVITPEWDLSGLERDLRILFEVALAVADADEQPRWFEGNEFEAAWRALYGR